MAYRGLEPTISRSPFQCSTNWFISAIRSTVFNLAKYRQWVNITRSCAKNVSNCFWLNRGYGGHILDLTPGSSSPPVRTWVLLKAENVSPAPLACRKRRLNGAVSLNYRIKRAVPCRCLDAGTLKNPTKFLWRWDPDRRSNFFISPPVHTRGIWKVMYIHPYNFTQWSEKKDEGIKVSARIWGF